MLLNHGVIGNRRVLALVNPDTSIDWLCMPRFDGPSVFARILDDEKGGSFAFEAEGMQTVMAYARNTNVLRTEVEPSMDGSKCMTSPREFPPASGWKRRSRFIASSGLWPVCRDSVSGFVRRPITDGCGPSSCRRAPASRFAAVRRAFFCARTFPPITSKPDFPSASTARSISC
jgi:hypothetical protein